MIYPCKFSLVEVSFKRISSLAMQNIIQKPITITMNFTNENN